MLGFAHQTTGHAVDGAPSPMARIANTRIVLACPLSSYVRRHEGTLSILDEASCSFCYAMIECTAPMQIAMA